MFSKNNKGFTLIELLVVVSVIALLLSIMLPALGKVRSQGERILCLSNMRQMHLASVNYNNTYDGYYPISSYTKIRDDGYSVYCWDFTKEERDGSAEITAGLLWDGETVEDVHQCPSYEGGDDYFGSPYTGYNYNTSYLGHGQGESINRSKYRGEVQQGVYQPIVMPAKVQQVLRPGNCALFGDGQREGGTNKFMRSPFRWAGDYEASYRVAGTQGYRHNGQTNVIWADGHAESQSKCYTNSYRSISRQLELYNQKHPDEKVGFLSADNSAYDLK